MREYLVTRWGRYEANVVVTANSKAEAENAADELEDDDWHVSLECEDGDCDPV